LDEGIENTQAFAWLCENAAAYGFILRYPKGDAEAVTEITYEPWHWRYVGTENAARYNASGMLCFEDYIAALQALAATA
jgi:D-alanyl-D-alanine carboxypeptidase